MHFFLTSPYSDVFLAILAVAAVLFARQRLARAAVSHASQKGRERIAGIGIALFLLSFVWCGATLAARQTNATIILFPALLMASVGWVIVNSASMWVQRHAWWLVAIGIVGVVAAVLWLLLSAGLLSRTDPHNFYVIFYPAIVLVTASIFLVVTPLLQWFFRTAGVVE